MTTQERDDRKKMETSLLFAAKATLLTTASRIHKPLTALVNSIDVQIRESQQRNAAKPKDQTKPTGE